MKCVTSICLDIDMYEWLQKRASARKVSMASVVRGILQDRIDDDDRNGRSHYLTADEAVDELIADIKKNR